MRIAVCDAVLQSRCECYVVWYAVLVRGEWLLDAFAAFHYCACCDYIEVMCRDAYYVLWHACVVCCIHACCVACLRGVLHPACACCCGMTRNAATKNKMNLITLLLTFCILLVCARINNNIINEYLTLQKSSNNPFPFIGGPTLIILIINYYDIFLYIHFY
jgi:hypothetical protein